MGKAEQFFCFLVDEPAESFPSAALHVVDNDGFETPQAREPLAADARPTADGRQGAKLKLIAGILGIGLDELRQRDLQRRHQRMLAITASSLFISCSQSPWPLWPISRTPKPNGAGLKPKT